MLSKLIIPTALFVATFLGLQSFVPQGVTFGAPTASSRIERTILPETTGLYELGTTSKTWLRGFFDNICLGGVCNSAWPSGSSQWTTAGNDIYYNTGNVGIGSSTPSGKLAIAGVSNGTNNIVMISTSTASATNTVFQIDSRGRTAIGNLNASATRGNSLTVISPAGSTDTFVQFLTSSGNPVLYARNDARVGIAGAPGSTFGVNGNTAMGANFVGLGSSANGLAVQGNVGFGTSSASLPALLTIATPNSSAGTTRFLFYAASTTAGGTATNTVATLTTTGSLTLGQTTNALPTNQSLLVTTQANVSANVGAAGFSMTLNNSSANASGYLRLDRTGSSAFVGLTLNSVSRDGLRFFMAPTGGSADEIARITPDGRFGIGTTTPFAWFTIATPNEASGATSTLFAIASSTATATTTLLRMMNTGALLLTGQFANAIASSSVAAASYSVDWNQGGTQRFFLNQSANFVINATSSNPNDGGTYKLKICQDGTGGRTATFVTPGQLRWYAGTTTISSAANTCTWIGMVYDSLGQRYDVIASSTGILAY